MMNKKGTLVLRNILFMMVLFGGVMALASIFVLDMAGSEGGYEDSEMYSNYENMGASSAGNVMISDTFDTVEGMSNSTITAAGSFELATGIISGLASILKSMFFAPVLIKNTFDTLLFNAGVPGKISHIIGNMVLTIIYVIIIMVIGSSLLKGGKI